MERLLAVFVRLQEHNFKRKPSKCELLKGRVSNLGHVVSDKGIHSDPAKIEAVKSWSVPKSINGMSTTSSASLAITGNSSRDSLQLHDLLVGHVTNPKARKKSVRKWVPLKLGPEQQSSFKAVIDKLTNPPVLAYADYSLPFKVHTDASLDGLGAVLYQTQEGVDRVIANASRNLKPSEKNYAAHKLEFLALKWSMNKIFHDYMVVCLRFLLTIILLRTFSPQQNLMPLDKRWVASLSDFNFTIKYRSGKKNADADGLSCRQEGNTGECTVSPDMINAVAMSVTAMECPFIGSVYVSEASDSTPPFTEDISEQLLQTHGLTAKDWRKSKATIPIFEFCYQVS